MANKEVGINTGVGGFKIDGKARVFDVGDKDSPGIPPVNVDVGDLKKTDRTGHDLSVPTKMTLAQYLSDSTLGKNGYAKGTPNSTPVDLSYSEISVSDEKGYPVNPSTNETSSVSQDLVTIAGQFKKGKSAAQVPNGDNFLYDRTIENPDKLPNVVVDKYQNSVLSRNRFTESNRFSAQSALTINGTPYEPNVLQQVGVLLSLRGSKEFPASDNDDLRPAGSGVVAGGLLPSTNQLGVLKVPNRLLEAIDALEHIQSDNDDQVTELDIAPIGNQSWGTLNNVEEEFSGLANVGMIALAVALQAAVILAFEGLSLLVGSSNSGAEVIKNADGSFKQGRYLSEDSGFFTDLFDMPKTRYPFKTALKTGTLAFFVGADEALKNSKAGVLGALLSTVTSTSQSLANDSGNVGFQIIVARTILRSFQSIAAGVNKLGNAFKSNPVSGLKSVASLLSTIKQTKFVAAMHVFARLGDSILSSEDKININDQHSDVVAPSLKGRLEKITTPAWASYRTPSVYLLPNSLAAMQLADSRLGGFKGSLGVSSEHTKSSVTPVKLTPKQIKDFETTLEAEYVPFYMHDLRTNEIISFHAFLESLSDSFTPGWESAEGYGRVEPVKIYKSTTRKLDVSFIVAALDRKDFDEMWVKINKLVTLVYPQYTRGRLLKDSSSTDAFIQPFSQLISASPLIRLRLGDLLKSNYSRFALARLFGAGGNDDMTLGGTAIKFESNLNNINGLNADKMYTPDNEFFINSTNLRKAQSSGVTSIALPGLSNNDPNDAFNVNVGDLQYVTVTPVTTKIENNEIAVKVSLMDAKKITETHGFSSEQATRIATDMEKKYSARDGTTIRVNVEHLNPTNKTWLSYYKKTDVLVGDSVDASLNKLGEFMNPEKNALVKSFQSVQGKGIAGVIDSLSFDWLMGNRGTWEIDVGSKAPKMCKVTLGFTPIHDITPGIDYMGYNRSPVYPVGVMGQGIDDDSETSGAGK